MPTSPLSGLSQKDAAERLQTEGPNELGTNQQRTLLAIIGEVAREPMFLLLLGAGAIYLVMGNAHEALLLLGFVIIIMAVTILQERRTETALAALRDLSSPRALVIRDGKTTRIAGREVVREDLLVLSEGDRVAADGQVIQAHELAVDESLLTGESEAVVKVANASQVFAGTLIVQGQGLILVSATGSGTELGRIGKSLQDISIESSPLRDEIAVLTRRLALIGIGLSLLLAALYRALRGGWMDGLLAGITLAMSILPQEFPVILIIFLSLGARRIARHKVLTRRLNAIETLGETTVLCVDKTGTLTQNRMAVAALMVGEETVETAHLAAGILPEAFHELLEYAVLASEIDPHDPMERAFQGFAREFLADSDHLHPAWHLAREYELSPDLLAMSHLWREESGKSNVIATKGAPEAIADLCHLGEDARRRLSAEAERMADRGLRVLGVAKAKQSARLPPPELQHDFDFEFLGLVGLADPLRPEVPGAVAECHRAGIRVVMITGDHPRTATAIAASAGIAGNEVLTGDDLAAMDTGSLAQRIAQVNVFARVSPQQKLAIVEALKAAGEVVAMTGDGVNDAPALKAAHIGIAMGKRGTDVAREAASLVLLDDDFTAIVTAIRLGRRIFANLRQAMVYTLTVHIPIIGLSILPLLFGLPLILAPVHIAFLELVIDPSCSIVFEAEEASDNAMDQPPRAATEHLIGATHFALSLTQGIVITVTVAAFYAWALAMKLPTEEVRALAFVALVAANAVLIFATRRGQTGWRAMFAGLSPVTAWVLGGTLAGLVLVTNLSPVAAMFTFQPPPVHLWLLAFAVGVSLLLAFSAIKVALASRR